MKKLIFITLLLASINVFSQHNIIGSLNYDNAASTPIQLVTLNLKNNTGTVVQTATTNQYGYFAFIAIADGSYTLELASGYKWGGVNPTDALNIAKYFIQSYNFKDALTKKAADVNVDKNANTTDALLISRRFVQISNSFKGGDWLFDDNTIIVNGADQFKAFKLICNGDVDGSYSPTYKFTNCGDNLIDSRDGKAYNTVLIGAQCWMAQNMNIGSKIDGINDQANNSIIEKYCYNNDENNCTTFGGLYQWDEMMQYVASEKAQGICPTGWHIPSDAESAILISFLGGDSQAGGKMKEKDYGHWDWPNTGADNSSGFTALPGGSRDMEDGNFYSMRSFGNFWSSSLFESSKAWYRYFMNNNSIADRTSINKSYGLSVRCLKDCPSINAPGSGSGIPSQNQIIWSWLTVSGAIGYKYNYTNDYSTAIDAGVMTGFTQSGLNCGSDYKLYIWAYNSCTASSPLILNQSTTQCPSTFNCGDNLIDTRDSKSYKTVLIGTQCWMKENLNVGTRINGASEQTDNGTIEKYCYNDDEANCSVYGGMYQWNEAMQYVTTEPIKGICPTGWLIPSEGDWGALINYVGGNSVAGGKLKETGTTHWASPNTSATDAVNFTALGAGMRFYNGGTYYYLTNRTYIWSSGVFDASNAYVRGPLYNYASITFGSFPKNDGMSVRCIKD